MIELKWRVYGLVSRILFRMCVLMFEFGVGFQGLGV